MSRWEFRILGPLEVTNDGRSVDIRGAKARALLALLVIDAGRVLSTDRLIDALWGDDVPARADNALQVYVSSLRKAFRDGGGGGNGRVGFAPLVTRRPGYVLQVDADLIDARIFERMAADGGRAFRAGRPAEAADQLRGALDLWRGEALEEFSFEPFARAEIDRLEELRVAALEDRIDADIALGRHREVIGELETLAVRWPLRERLRGQLMLALYRSGRQAEALDAFRETREVLADQLGIDPSPTLQRLEEAILRQDRELDPPRAAAEPTYAPLAMVPDLVRPRPLLRRRR